MRRAGVSACSKSSNGCKQRFATNLGSTRWNTFLTSDFAVRANKPNCATRHGVSERLANFFSVYHLFTTRFKISFTDFRMSSVVLESLEWSWKIAAVGDVNTLQTCS